jgi:hypothetical protein
MPASPVKTRPLRRQDIQSALKIQRKITGRSPKAGWKKELETHIKDYPKECLAAEYAGTLAGFIIGEVKTLEFGVEKSGWIVASSSGRSKRSSSASRRAAGSSSSESTRSSWARA